MVKRFFNSDTLTDDVATMSFDDQVMAFQRRIEEWYLIPLRNTGHEAFIALLGLRAAISCVSTFTGMPIDDIVLLSSDLCDANDEGGLAAQMLQSMDQVYQTGCMPYHSALCVFPQLSWCTTGGTNSVVFFDPWKLLDNFGVWLQTMCKSLMDNPDSTAARRFELNLLSYLSSMHR